jgi:hypothetical protein
MGTKTAVAPMVLLGVIVALLMASAPVGSIAGSVALAPAPAPAPASHVGTAASALTTASAALPTTFPRTVLIETFTAVWCIHCPAESQALWNIDHSTNRSVIDIAELHVCAFAPGSGPCLENYVPPDGTSDARVSFYDVQGFPTVFFDGQHPQYGATNDGAQMEGIYNSSIANASAIPGNVSISQSATISYGNVTERANITSGITGTYNAITYLLESINKVNVSNGYGPHDLGDVVRATLYNHPVTLTAGATTGFTVTAPLNASWNQQNLSVVTFVQQNSTKTIENANLAPASFLAANVEDAQSSVSSYLNSTVTVHVANTTTGLPVSGAAVTLSSNYGGTFTPNGGVTAANGSFMTTFAAPSVTSTVWDVIAAVATAGTDTGYATTMVAVNPLLPPTAPTGLTITPGVNNVTLNWTVPSTGGGGVTYYVSQSASSTGAFSVIGLVGGTTYKDTGLAAGSTYWYKVAAADAAGFSVNTSAISASAVTADPVGLPSNVGWWLALDAGNFSATTGVSLTVYLPVGVYPYSFGPVGDAVLATPPTAPLTVSASAFTFDANFTANLATLEGSVTPTDASVTLNGTAVPVADGEIFMQVVAGTYTLVVSSPGYQTVSKTVVLTPGGVTTVPPIQLQATAGPASGTTSSGSGVSGTELVEIFAIGAVAAIAVFAGVAVMMSRSRRGGRPPRSDGADPPV